MKSCRGEILQYVAAAALVFLPILASMSVSDNDHSWSCDLLVFVGFSAVLLAVMVLARLSRWWLTPLVLASLIYSSFVWVTRCDVGYHAVSAMYETNFQEATEFLKSPTISSGLLVLGLLFVLSLYCLHCRWRWRWAVRPIRVPRTWLVVLAVLGGASLTTFKALGNDFADVYPMKFICQNMDYYNEVHLVRKEYHKVVYTYHGDPIDDRSETYIIILGESARRMNWGLYGYDRPTTPQVRRWLNEHPASSALFSRAAGSGRVTRVSVLVALSVVNAREYAEFYKQPSILRVFRAAGCKTFVTSAQPSTGFYEGLANMVFGDADVVAHLDQRGVHYALDEQLLPVLDEFLQDPAARKLIVVHLQGSHLEYAERYPKPFDQFHGKGAQVDSYDNSILYTDWVIRQIFERAAQLQTPTMVFYASDHGENLNDSGDGNFSHGAMEINKYETDIPMVCYFNDAFVDRKPEAVRSVLRHKDDLMTHDMIAHTFLGLCGVNDPAVYQPTFDLSSERFNPGELYFADNWRTIMPLADVLKSVGSGIDPDAPVLDESDPQHAANSRPEPALH